MSTSFPPGIADFRDGQASADPWVNGPPPREQLAVVAADPAWPGRFAELAARITAALGPVARSVVHVGSTAVPGLAAKDVIDIDLCVADPSDEASYVPALTAIGYQLTVREPEFEDHRMLRLAAPRVNLHVTGPGSAEAARHLLFRDWLRAHPAERELYAAAKRDAAEGDAQTAMEYNARKTAVVREILARTFAGNGISLRDRALAPERLPELPAEAGGERITWRAATSDDAELIHRVSAAAGRVDHPNDLYSLEQVRLALRGERFTLATDTVLGLSEAGEPIAYGEARLGDTDADTIEVSLEGLVHPSWRGRGIGTRLLAWQEARARQLLANSGVDLPALISLGTREDNSSNRALYAAAGFLPVRWWMELWRSLADPIVARPLPDGLRLRDYTAELSEATRLAVNDAFRDHWGSRPASQQEWEEEHALADFAPHLSRLAVVGDGSAADPFRVLGAVLSEVDEEEWALNGGPFGYISTIAVIRGRRGEGISSALILETLAAMREAGLERAALDVDAANPSGALGMYTKLGFALRDRSVTYGKRA